jgi:hypothetical protein
MSTEPDIVAVFVAPDSLTERLARNALEEAGIPCFGQSEDRHLLPGFHGASGIGEVPLAHIETQLFVHAGDAEKAREILAIFMEPPPGAPSYTE